MYEQIKCISKYLKQKYPNRNTLKMGQVADEFLMSKNQIRELKKYEKLGSLSIKNVATFIVQNPPLK